MAASLNAKFVRSILVSPATATGPNGCMLWIMRLTWEFWGFCVNGSNDLLNPGGVATSNVTGSYISMPTGFRSGTTVLLASGSDGVTTAGSPVFNATSSLPFSYTCEGKWLTTWKSGSTSTDDSIYRIVKWISSSSIKIDPTSGGTPSGVTGSLPALTSRSDINYRVIDYLAASNLSGFVTGNYIVMQMDNAAAVNVGQRNSQFKITCNDAGLSTFTQLGLTLSPSGTWDGTQFVGESYPVIVPDTTNSGPGSGGRGTPNWFASSNGGSGYLTLIGGRGFLICQAGGSFMVGGTNGGGSAFQVEVPTRLYPQQNDPNPICALNMGGYKFYVTAQVGYAWASWFFPSPYDSTLRRWAVYVRCPTGSYFNFTPWTNSSVDSPLLVRWPLLYNKLTNQAILPDPVLSMPTVNGQASASGQFSLARAHLRSTKYAGGFARYSRFDDAAGGRWIHGGGGVIWPWDHALVSNRDIFTGMG